MYTYVRKTESDTAFEAINSIMACVHQFMLKSLKIGSPIKQSCIYMYVCSFYLGWDSCFTNSGLYNLIQTVRGISETLRIWCVNKVVTNLAS